MGVSSALCAFKMNRTHSEYLVMISNTKRGNPHPLKKACENSFDGESMEQLWKEFCLMLSISRCSLVENRFANEFSLPRLSVCGFGLWMD